MTMATPLPAVTLPGPRARPRVLLVDDEEIVRLSVSRCLDRLGFAVVTAASGPEGLDALAAETFDAILTDHHMPGMSGGEFIAQALARDPSLGRRIIVTSGDLHSDATRKLVAAAGVRAIQKPFELAELARTVRAVAQGVKSER